MKRMLLSLIALILSVPAASAWNDKGHMAITRLAWKELAADERGKIGKMLESHPHYKEFLCADRPEAIPPDEWAFMRAATWSDWVRSGPPERKAYNRPEWHYINLTFVPNGDDTKPAGVGDVNVVTQIEESRKIATSGGDRVERAVRLAWVFHLVTDMHQPLHCCSRWSKMFPEGDQGGNKMRVRLAEGGSIQLHSFWDGLFGKELSESSLGKSVLEMEQAFADNADAIKAEIDQHRTVMEWAKESNARAVKYVYLDGAMPDVASLRNAADADLAEAPKGYAQQAGECARYQGAKGAKRLAAVLKEIAAAN